MSTSEDIEPSDIGARTVLNAGPTTAPASRDKTGPAANRHSPVFLAVFTVFLFSTAICVAITVLGVCTGGLMRHDTLFFWESGHLLLHGHNPYDRETIRQVELGMGFPLQGKDVVMTLETPFVLFLLLPLGLFAGQQAVFAWSLFLALCLGVSVWAVQKAAGYSGPGYLLLACFFPAALFCIENGQTGLISLLGLALFLRYQEERPFWAGAALSLCAVKPHLLLPFGAVLLSWIAMRRRWSLAVGVVFAMAIESLIAMAFDPWVWANYRAMARTEPFGEKMVPRLGMVLSLLIGRRALWLEFVPAGLAIIWGIWYFLRDRDRWDWRTHGSVLTLVSLMVAPYAWVTDQVIVIPAMLFVMLGAKRPRKGSLTLLLAIMVSREVAAMITRSLFGRVDIEIDTVFSIVWLVWYLYATSSPEPAKDALAAV